MERMRRAAAALDQNNSPELSLFHHNDTDGISSGTILIKAFEKAGYRFSSCSLEKPYPPILEQILSQKNKIIVFADFAGKIAPLISRINQGRNLVIIIDHHPAEDCDDESVWNLNGDLHGLKGDRDISASATAYLFAEVFLSRKGMDSRFLSHLGVLGAIGDGFLVDGCLHGVNREVLEIAVDQGLMRLCPTPSGEDYYISLGASEYEAGKVCDALDTLGGVAYYDDGVTLGRELCLSGFNPALSERIEELKLKREEIFSRELKRLKTEIRTTGHLQWFNVEDRFRPMGVKMIGVFCVKIRNMDFLDRSKYLAGFQNVPDFVPGFGEIAFHASKISMRVSDYLTEQIRGGETAGLSSFLPEATDALDGFVDACHGLSAATTVDRGREERLIEEIEKVIKKRMDD